MRLTIAEKNAYKNFALSVQGPLGLRIKGSMYMVAQRKGSGLFPEDTWMSHSGLNKSPHQVSPKSKDY